MCKIPSISCRDTQLQSFQYRIINRILSCNNWLYTLKVIDTNICNSFVTWWNNLDFQKLNPLIEENIILGFIGHSNEYTVLNYWIILGKYFIYTCKRNQKSLFFMNFIKLLKHKLIIEEEIHVQNSTTEKFNSLWGSLFETI